MTRPSIRITSGALIISGLIFIISFLGVAYTLKDSHDQAAQNRKAVCRAQNSTRKAVFDLLNYAESVSLKNLDLTAKERARTIDFYTKAESYVRPLKC